MSKKKKPYTVGYRKPPQHTKFKPGRSGNPKGRPKKMPMTEETMDLCECIVAELRTKILVTQNGNRIGMTKQEALSKKLVNKALEGDGKSIALLMHPDLRGAIERRIAALNAQVALEEEIDLSTLTDEELTKRYLRAIGQAG